MQLLILECDLLDSEEVLGAEPVDRATWLMLLRYCAGRENGGRIEGCAGWKDRKWQQLARVTYEEVRRETRLWWWEGEDLVVGGYPVEREAKVLANRENGRLGGLAKARNARQGSESYHVVPHVPYRDPSNWPSETPTEKRREEKSRVDKSAVSSTPLRARIPSDGLVEIPCKGTTATASGSWWLTAKVVEELRREYPSVDPVAVAEDMARKIRSGARVAPTTRGARRMVAAWVAREAVSPSKVNGAKTWQAHLHAGASDPAAGYPWHPDDVRRYQDDPRWDAYMDEQMRTDAIVPSRSRWERFETWCERTETVPAQPDGEREVVHA